MKAAATGKSFKDVLTGMGEAKSLLRLALSPNLSHTSKQQAFLGTLKECPQAARYPEAAAALWLLS